MKQTLYLILGEDAAQREARWAALRQRAVPTDDARRFDYDVLYADKLDPRAFKETLLALPVMSPRRFILLHDGHKLKTRHKDLLLDFVQGRPDHVLLVVESGTWTAADSFVKKLRPYAELVDAPRGKKATVFDMTREMERSRPDAVLRSLAELFADGQHPLQLMGGILWFWQQNGPRLPGAQYQEGLRLLQEADLNIKRSRLNPEYALEILVVRLTGLLG